VRVRPRVLVVDDDRAILTLVGSVAVVEGFDVATTVDGTSALQQLAMEDSAKAAEQGLALGADDLHPETVRAISPDRARQGGVQAAASGCVIASATSTHRGSNA
jgi:CheY-like chemotaxis protein